MVGEDQGRFGFDGADGIAFWVYSDSTHEHGQAVVRFNDLEDLRVFLQHNLPGLFTSAPLLNGATNQPTPETRVANAGEFAAVWNTRTPAEREHIVEVINARAEQALACILWDHEGAVEELRAKVQSYALDRARHAAHPELNTVGSGRIASDLFQLLGLPYPTREEL